MHDSSFIEQLGSGSYYISEKIRSLKHQHLIDIQQQINDFIVDEKIINYKPPKSAATGYTTRCLKDEYYDWSLLKQKMNRKH